MVINVIILTCSWFSIVWLYDVCMYDATFKDRRCFFKGGRGFDREVDIQWEGFPWQEEEGLWLAAGFNLQKPAVLLLLPLENTGI